MANLTDLRISKFRSTLGLTTQIRSVHELERDYYASVSGLPAKRSVADHKKAFFALKGFAGLSISDAELAYFKSKGAVGAAASSIASDFYANRLLG